MLGTEPDFRRPNDCVAALHLAHFVENLFAARLIFGAFNPIFDRGACGRMNHPHRNQGFAPVERVVVNLLRALRADPDVDAEPAAFRE